MQTVNFESVVERIIERDGRYQREAYTFVREALEHTQKGLARTRTGKTVADQERHVSGQELLTGIREFALAQFGPMAQSVLDAWGVARCEDFGEIVFNLVESELLRKRESDTRQDFQGGFDFFEAFRKPFVPSRRHPLPAPGLPAA